MTKSGIKRVSTAEAVFEHLTERIRSRELKAGDRLPSERQLQEELGVGRLALREGLARMSALGLIRVEHGRGACVQDHVDNQAIARALTPLDPERDTKTLMDLVNARCLIEGETAALASVHRTQDDIGRLEALAATPCEDLDETELADLDYAFHREVARIAGNEFLAIMLEVLQDHVRSFLHHYVRTDPDRTEVMSRHLPILKAIIERDAKAARSAIHSHINMCKSSLDTYIERINKGK